MHAVEITSFGGPEVLRLGERPAPAAGAGELLIRVAASGINRPDVLQRMGHYAPPPGTSDLPGLEVAGVVESGDALAMAEAGIRVGDRVCALVAGGGYAQWCVAPVVQCLPVPDGFSDVEAASLPETFFTVWSNVFDRARLQAGETFLVQGGTSGIGVTAIQLARAFGATVIATAGSDDKCAACLALGAHHAVNYKSQDFVAEAKRITEARGVDVVLDMVAGDYVAREVECLAEDGRIVIIAVQGVCRAVSMPGWCCASGSPSQGPHCVRVPWLSRVRLHGRCVSMSGPCWQRARCVRSSTARLLLRMRHKPMR